MIIDRDSLSEIGATLSRNKTRTFLTAFGIFWGTLILALLIGGGQGARRMLYSNFAGFATNSAFMVPQPTKLPYKGYKKGMTWNFTTYDVINIRRRVPELASVSPMVNRYSSVKSSRKGISSKQQASICAIEPSYFEICAPILTQGRLLGDVDVAQASKVCLIGQRLANSLFRGGNPLGQSVEVDGATLKVVGVTKKQGDVSIGGDYDESVFIPITTADRIYNVGNRVDAIVVLAKDKYTPTSLRDKIYRVLCSNHPLHPDDKGNMWFWDVSEMFDQIDTMFSGFDLLLLFVGFSSLLAGIIGVGNIMWIVVKERTKEFGIRRAIGARPSTIMAQILAESAVLTVIAGMAAVTFATAILYVVTMAVRTANSATKPEQNINFLFSFSTAVGILILFIVLGCAAGTIPAFKAMKIKPIEALNDK